MLVKATGQVSSICGDLGRNGGVEMGGVYKKKKKEDKKQSLITTDNCSVGEILKMK